MKPKTRLWNILIAFAIVLVTCVATHACQDTQEDAINSGLSEEAKAFQKLQTELKTNQSRIDFLYRTLPVGFPQKRKQYKDEIERLTAANIELKTQVFSKAKAAFQASDNPSAQSTRIVSDRLASMLKPRNAEKQFDPESSLELIAMMKEKFPDNPSLLEYEFLANYAIERFENAEVALGKLENLTGADLSLPKEELKATIEKYQQELLIRRLESNTDDLPRVLLVTTEGDILVELFENHAPNTVANFIHLVRDQKFYDGKLFHLVRPGEYAMSGSPNGDGMGDAGYRIPCECYEEKIRSHFRGTLSMMAPSKDRGGSQFFITQQPNPHTYDGKYTAFGRVIEGMDVVLKLKNIDLSGRMASSEAVSKIIRAEVVRARSHTYIPEKVAANEVNRFSGSGSKNGSNSRNPAADDAVDTPGSFDLLLQGDEGK
jgi:cyclophilin family peptidyl-prolyl cis-trans isomerase/predicted HTH domain antitoxin